jgi:hypothetical protein
MEMMLLLVTLHDARSGRIAGKAGEMELMYVCLARKMWGKITLHRIDFHMGDDYRHEKRLEISLVDKEIQAELQYKEDIPRMRSPKL